MRRFRFTVFSPDRHKPMLFLFAAASLIGTLAGTFLSVPDAWRAALLRFGARQFFVMAFVLLFVIFLLGFCRLGRFLIPLLLAVFSAQVSAYFRTHCAGTAIRSPEFFIPAAAAGIIFLSVFFLSAQACIVSRHFPIRLSGHARNARPQRAFYVFEYAILNFLMAACFAGLVFFT